MTSNASIGLRPWEIGQFRDIAENQATFETLQTTIMEPTITQNGAVFRALKNGSTGFRTCDALGGKTAANQIGTLSRWNKGEQTP